MTISEKGKTATYAVSKSVEGGLVEIKATNKGKAPHAVQLVRVEGNHTAPEALKIIAGNSDKIPNWIRGQGGVGGVAPGKSGSATVNLPAGNYFVADLGGPSAGKPGYATFKVSGGSSGDLPSTPGTVVAAHKGKDKFAWDISGLKAGSNDVTFKSEGDDALHLILAVPIKGKAPSLSQIKKDLSSNGPPPPWADFQDAQQTAVLDGGRAETTSLELKKPGQYLFFCPLTDRDGGKPHFLEGLLQKVSVK